MPTYTYNGTTTYVDSTYGVRAEPGDTVTTTYFLPQSLTQFTLTNANTPTPIVPKSKAYALATNTPQTISIKGYSSIQVILPSPGSNVVTLKFYHAAQTSFVTLDANNPSFSTDLGYSFTSESLIVEATTGSPTIIVNFKFTAYSGF